METKEEKEAFNYTYSAKEQEEVKAIRKKYAAPEENKLEQLRRLDEGVTKKASTISLAVGIIGALILGFGMSIAMSDLSKILGSYEDTSMLIGITVGIVGIAVVCVAYPIYNHIIRKEREKLAPEIIRLTDELLK